MNAHRECLRKARAWKNEYPSNVVGFGIGKRQRTVEGRTVATDETCVVVLVQEKLSPELLNARGIAMVPAVFGHLSTDVQQSEPITALVEQRERRDPVDGGASVGHPGITAGTLGGWCLVGPSEQLHILSNNHVLAGVNEAELGDLIVQPGNYDGGRLPADECATLVQFAQIRFNENDPKGKIPGLIGRSWWKSLVAIGNAGAKLTGCPFRLHVGMRGLEQPFPNLIDAAVARHSGPRFAHPDIRFVGDVEGMVDLDVNDPVEKDGRTTGYTKGVVTGVEFEINVNMGDERIAPFAQQIRINAPQGIDFSAGGDSGSWIIHSQSKRFGGLLFAGGGADTYANTSANVASILGVRIP